jgi:hypothetical protein
MVRLTYMRIESLPDPNVVGRSRVAIEHALRYSRPSLWGDDTRWPESAILIRGRGKNREAYGIGSAQPAIAWLAEKSRGGPVSLIAPGSWDASVREVFGPVEQGTVETWALLAGGPAGPAPSATVTHLSAADAIKSQEYAPDWMARSWKMYLEMFLHGFVCGVPYKGKYASLAWIFEEGFQHISIGVWTDPLYRQLGLGRAAALGLLEYVKITRKIPIWVTSSENEASRALARSLGFSCQGTETLLRWPARQPNPLQHPG